MLLKEEEGDRKEEEGSESTGNTPSFLEEAEGEEDKDEGDDIENTASFFFEPLRSKEEEGDSKDKEVEKLEVVEEPDEDEGKENHRG